MIVTNWPELRDLIMRFSPAALALSATLALVSSVSFAQSNYQPTEASNELIVLGQAAQDKGEFDAAYNFYESALVADPRNANAYIAMAQIAERQYDKALHNLEQLVLLEPDTAEVHHLQILP